MCKFDSVGRVVTECVNIVIAGWGVEWGARPSPGPGRGNVCISTSDTVLLSIFSVVADFGVVPIPPCGIGNVHRSVAGSFAPAKIPVPLYHTSHFSLSNTTLHPALHNGQIPIREAIFNDGTM